MVIIIIAIVYYNILKKSYVEDTRARPGLFKPHFGASIKNLEIFEGHDTVVLIIYVIR